MATPIHTAPMQSPPPAQTAGAPIIAANDTASANDNGPNPVAPYNPVARGIGHANPANDTAPLHTQTQSTLAPTSEWVRYLLLALPARYVPRGIVGMLYETEHHDGNMLSRGLAKLSSWFQKATGVVDVKAAKSKEALVYNAIMGVGSLALSASYARTVYGDIKNIFSEAVAEETGKPISSIGWGDLKQSDNRIVQKTIENFWQRSARRLATDVLFFPAAIARSTGAGDLGVGLKALQAFGETWKRKTTMFEDLITFVNNKINPRNGLGQTIGVGEVFDLYQHYAQEYNPSVAFNNVLEREAGEGAVWAQNQPIFERMTELMNLTYAYKHRSVLDATTGQAIRQADFALPKFIYLLGHDLIDVKRPDETLARIEVANRYGIGAVKEMQTMLASGANLEQIAERFPIALHEAAEKSPPATIKNGVIAKGSTVQLDRAEAAAPANTIDANSVAALQTIHSQHTQSQMA